MLVERKRVGSRKRMKATGPFSDADYASVSQNSRVGNAATTEDGLSIGATSPAKMEGKVNEIGDLNQLKIQISVESNEESKKQQLDMQPF